METKVCVCETEKETEGGIWRSVSVCVQACVHICSVCVWVRQRKRKLSLRVCIFAPACVCVCIYGVCVYGGREEEALIIPISPAVPLFIRTSEAHQVCFFTPPNPIHTHTLTLFPTSALNRISVYRCTSKAEWGETASLKEGKERRTTSSSFCLHLRTPCSPLLLCHFFFSLLPPSLFFFVPILFI